jgi:hypothetical protein
MSMFWWVSSWRRYYNGLKLHAVVNLPLTSFSVGHISCRAVGVDPIEFTWYGPNGGDVQTDLSGADAFGVVPGRYRVVATDADDRGHLIPSFLDGLLGPGTELVGAAAFVAEFLLEEGPKDFAHLGLERRGRITVQIDWHGGPDICCTSRI